ncbi:MAG: PEP-CTERM sorting domain-containing protein [Verrucomicrobiae bacterium]|nr:PEP-CTERM sorting domain-containing protein [Verrucomicrobiae bacterium]NNJ86928.1 PEP-CTERM sorting domain-containing protein [Akkermansiaceae bacterium]
MKKLTFLTTLSTISVFAINSVSAAVLQSFGEQSVGGVSVGSSTIVDTTNDTGNWIDNYNDSADSGTLYYSFDITIDNNVGETGGGGFFTALQLYDGDSERIAIGNNWRSVNWSYFGGGDGDLNGPVPYLIGQTVNIAARVDFNAGANDSITIWLNPVAGVAEGSQALSATTSVSDRNAQFNNIRLRAGNGTGATTFNNIIFATEFADVVAVPEPSSTALLCLGGLALILRRRR